MRVHAGCSVRAEVGRGEAESERGEDGEGDDGRLRERVAEGDPHEWRGAGRGDDDGEDSGEEAAGVALLCGECAAGAGERESDFKLAGEREAKEEEQRGHQREEDGRLELESPAEMRARGAKAEKHADENPEGDENAERVDEAVGAELVALFPAGLDQRQALDEEHGEDAGHQVEDESAEKSEAGGLE